MVFLETTQIYQLNTQLGPNRWPFFYEVFRFLLEQKNKNKTHIKKSNFQDVVVWTVILNEQIFLLTQNLRMFLAQQMLRFDINKTPAVIGRRVNLKYLLLLFFN